MAKEKIKKGLSPERLELKLLCEGSLVSFIEYIHPRRYLGSIHREIISWWTSSTALSHQLLLLPRDHMKSALVAYRVAWEIVKNPSIRILYISSTSNLATKQLKFIKDILASDKVRALWPELVNKEEAKREKWTEREISVDHPLRKEDAIRDPTIFTAGLTTNIIGMHCDIAVLDDVVVTGNAYTEDGREKVKEQYGYLSSIETVGAKEWVVGTRYHPKDLYSDLQGMVVRQYDEFGNEKSNEYLFESFERQVESNGDMTGEYIWPRTQAPDGKWYGFNQEVLAIKKGQYLNPIHFRAQYYNDPNDIDSSVIQRNLFQYYNPDHLYWVNSRWMYGKEPLNVVASVDFAYSLSKAADYTSIVVVGVDGNNNFYILEIDRFKAIKPSEYFQHILKLYEKWGFRKLRAEVTAAQKALVEGIKEDHIRKHGLSLSIDEFKPSRWEGSKQERILSVLEPRYANKQIWHYPSGNTQILEEELIYTNPPHDDVKDALASAIDFAVAPKNLFRTQKAKEPMFQFHSRWGGVA